MQSLVSVLAQRASETPDRILINDITGLDRTYRQLWDDALRWAGALRGLGVHRGDAVGLMLPPSSEACAVQIACAVAGAVCVPLSPLLRGNPLTHALRACGVTTLITRDALLSGEQLAVCAKAATLKRAVLTDVADADYRAHRIDIRGWGQVLTGATPIHWAGTEMEPAQALILTSGTSGPPKPVRITYTALDSYAANVVNAPAQGWEPDSGYYSPWALCHALGFIALGTAVYRGQRLVLRDGVDLDSYWADIRRFDCHLAVAVSIAAALWKQPPRPDDHDNPLRVMVMAPVIPEFKEFGERFGIQVSSIYGATEIGPALTSPAPASHRMAGRPTPGYELRLVDADGRDVGPGTVGELLVRHQHRDAISVGYADRRASTETAWSDGWFHTGDRFVAVGADFQFVDRVADAIRHHGRNISSWQIEEEVRTHPAVEECACVGVPSAADSKYGADGSDVRLFVAVRPGRRLDADELIGYLRPRLPPYMLPRYYDFVDTLPVNASGRVRKAELRALPVHPDTVDRKSPGAAVREPATGAAIRP